MSEFCSPPNLTVEGVYDGNLSGYRLPLLKNLTVKHSDRGVGAVYDDQELQRSLLKFSDALRACQVREVTEIDMEFAKELNADEVKEFQSLKKEDWEKLIVRIKELGDKGATEEDLKEKQAEIDKIKFEEKKIWPEISEDDASEFQIRVDAIEGEKRELTRKHLLRCAQNKAEFAAAQAELYQKRSNAQKLERDLIAAKETLAASTKEVAILRQQTDDFKSQASMLSDDLDATCREHDALSLLWQKERCQWAEETELLKLEVHRRNQLVQGVIDDTNGKLRADLIAKNTGLRGENATLAMKLETVEKELKVSRDIKIRDFDKERTKLSFFCQELAKELNSRGKDREELMQSLRDVMAQMAEVFGDFKIESSWNVIQNNIPHEGLKHTLAVFLQNFMGTTYILAERVWGVLSTRKIIVERDSVIMTTSGSNEEALKNWHSQLAAAEWDECDFEDLTKELRKVMQLDHKWKIYKGCKHSGVDLEDHRRLRTNFRDHDYHDCHQSLLIAEIHERSEYGGFCIEEDKVKMFPEELTEAHFVKGEETHLVYYWAHQDDHEKIFGGYQEKVDDRLNDILGKNKHGLQQIEKAMMQRMLSDDK